MANLPAPPGGEFAISSSDVTELQHSNDAQASDFARHLPS
jgi:hypothetical protein